MPDSEMVEPIPTPDEPSVWPAFLLTMAATMLVTLGVFAGLYWVSLLVVAPFLELVP